MDAPEKVALALVSLETLQASQYPTSDSYSDRDQYFVMEKALLIEAK